MNVTIKIPRDVQMFFGGDATQFVLSCVTRELGKISPEAAQHVLDANAQPMPWQELPSDRAVQEMFGGLAER